MLRVVHDRLARGKQALGITIAGRILQIGDHVFDDLVRGEKAEWRRIADIELDDAMTFFFHALGVLEHRAANVVADVGEFL
ncbi:hypothetical protein D3C85_1415060 [compost metagenome]